MSNREPHDPGLPGEPLPEDARSQLKHLRDQVAFLFRLAQPRTREEAGASTPEAGLHELAIGLELLAVQLDRWLDDKSTSDDQQAGTYASAPATKSARNPAAPSRTHLTFGISLHQIDAFDHLIQRIAACGDVVAADRAVELADRTLPLLGQAIFDDAQAVRDLLDRVEAQRLAPARRPHAGVREAHAVYGAVLAWRGADDPTHAIPGQPTAPLPWNGATTRH